MTASTASPVSPRRYRWLVDEVGQWQSEALIDTAQAAAIAQRYTPTRRFELIQLVVGLGAGFVGVGVIWLVATNFDQISPAIRFALVAALWLGLLVLGEWTHDRRPGAMPQALRGLAAICFGAVIFQAAQSLQVPAFEAGLQGLWALGALAHAYLGRAPGPFAVGLVTGLMWLQAQLLSGASDPLDVIVPLALAGLAGVGIAGAHRNVRGFATGWREVGLLLGLVALFLSTFPPGVSRAIHWQPSQLWLVAAAVLFGALGAVLGARRGDRLTRWELLGTLGVGVLAGLLALWPGTTDVTAVGPLDWLRTSVGIVGFLLASAALAADGVLRESWRLTMIAFGGLALFTTFQAFAVIGPIVSGAWLFLLIGLLLMIVGLLGEHGRRRLTRVLRRRPA